MSFLLLFNKTNGSRTDSKTKVAFSVIIMIYLVEQWLELLSLRRSQVRLSGLSLWSLHVLPGVSPGTKNMHISFISNSNLSLRVDECEYLFVSL